MFPDYTALVLADYKRKKEANTLSLGMLHPTPGKLKRECLTVCQDRLAKKDYQFLKAVFGEFTDQASCMKAIDRREVDKFRPLLKFMNGQIDEPDISNVELLAWLIEFDQRPFVLGKKYRQANQSLKDVAEIEEPMLPGLEDDQVKKKAEKASEIIPLGEEILNGGSILASSRITVSEPKFTPSAIISHYKPSRKKVFIGFAVVAAVLVGGAFLLKNENPLRGSLTGHEACMYWTGDHYQPISCNQKVKDTLVVALDSARLVGFRRITREDTITSNSLGKVWYARIHGEVEFYTSEGNGKHPVYLGTPLHRLTPYMLKTHVKPKN